MNVNRILKYLSSNSALEFGLDNYIIKLQPNVYQCFINGDILEYSLSELKYYLKTNKDLFTDIDTQAIESKLSIDNNQVELFNVDNFGNELEFYKNKTREVVQGKFNNFASNIYQLANNLCNFLESNGITPSVENKTTLKVNGKLKSITSQQSIMIALIDLKKAICISYPSAQINPIYSTEKCNLKAILSFNIALYKNLITRYQCT